jgi:ribonuclease VapC
MGEGPRRSWGTTSGGCRGDAWVPRSSPRVSRVVVILDTSALLAILQDEPERGAFVGAIEAAASCSMSVASFVETSIVLEARYGAEGLRSLDLFLERAGVELVPVDREQAIEARRAYLRFGRGRHPAGLNYGDCFAYALAHVRAEPLLFKGTDFGRTDLMSAVGEAV